MAQPRTVSMDASFFDCAFCRTTLKPPTFMCDDGHVVCQLCSADAVNEDRCMPCPDIDRALGAVMVSCEHKDQGCTALVASHASADHLRSCPFVPCKCPRPNCCFTASPAALLRHFSEKHGCPVARDYVYGQPCELRMSGWRAFAQRHDVRAALAGESDDCLFVVYGSVDLGPAQAKRVSVVCLRASEDAAMVASQFRCELWVEDALEGEGGGVFSFRVPSSDGSGLVPDGTASGAARAHCLRDLHPQRRRRGRRLQC